MKNKSLKIILILAMSLLCGVGYAMRMSAEEGAPAVAMAEKGGEYGLQRILSQLNLTSRQQQQVDSLRRAALADNHEIYQHIVANSEQLREAMRSPTVNLDLVRRLAGNQSDYFTSLIVNQAKFKNEIYNILTPDQRAHFTRLLNEMDQKKNSFSK